MEPLFRTVDCHSLPVADLDAAIAFYGALGHEVIWRDASAAGLRLPDSDAELVLHTDNRPIETDLKVKSVPETIERFTRAGGTLVAGPFEIRIGQCAVLRDPWNNPLVVLDASKGLLDVDASGRVIGNRPPDRFEIRDLRSEDAAVISSAFAAIGWNKPTSQYDAYLAGQEAGERDVLVAALDGRFAGYVTIRWRSTYAPFAETGIPEIQDFNVLPQFRRQRIGTRLMDRAEHRVARRCDTVGIGVGMYADYGHAQRLYVLRGYVPDGRGLTYRGEVLPPMAGAINDDDLVLFFTKKLR